MLTDEQVDELERLIVYATMDNLPLILSRAIPLLFSELRTVRATLDARINSFFGGLGNGLPEGSDTAGLPERNVGVERRPEVPLAEEAGPAGSTGGDSPAQELPENPRPKRGRNRRKKGVGESGVDGGSGQPEVGGEVLDASGGSGCLPLSPISGLGR